MRFINFLKMSSLALMLCLATQLQAADVDVTAAQNAARSFLAGQVVSGRMKAQAMTNLTLVKAEASVAKPTAVDYYIFNAEKSYVVIAGDDQAPEVLMYGDEGALDIDNIPPAMQWLLNKYKYQIDGIKAGTLAPVNVPRYATAIAPLVNANWDQSAPYNNQCPTSGSRHALTGCPATSLAMCYYKWKWPKTFPAVAAIPSSAGIAAAALPERQADWDNIIDEYTGPSNYSSTSAQKDAVAWLMRYAGQAIPDYNYGTSASGANDPEIYQGVLNMGYVNAQYLQLTELVSSGWSYGNSAQKYTDAQWNSYMMAELQAGRPIEYLAYDISYGQVSGHAFNVFGCDASGKYYVNWGWSGDSNGYCTLHNFTTSTGATGQSGSYVFKYGEAMIIGIEPPASAMGPSLNVNTNSIGFTSANQQKLITLTGSNLTNDVIVTVNDPNDAFTVTCSAAANAPANGMKTASGTMTIPANRISEDNPVNIIVTFKGNVQESVSGSVTLSSVGAETVSVALNAASQAENTGGTATDNYFDVAKYYTIDDVRWQSNYVTGLNNIYKYTEYPSEGVAWFTMSVYGAWTGYYYNSNPLKWIKSTQNGTTNYNGSATWNASAPMLGSSAYFSSNNSKYFGPTNNANTSKTISFYVTNITNFYILGVNNSNATTGTGNKKTEYPTTIKIYECAENNGAVTTTQQIVEWSDATNNLEIALSLTSDLDPEKIYLFEFGVTRAKLYEVGFSTPLPIPETPTIVDAVPTATTADITWTSGENNESWNLRYREAAENTFFDDFENGLGNWTIYTDGTAPQANGWTITQDGSLENVSPVSGNNMASSWSWSSTAYNADNWLITPQVTFGEELSFWVRTAGSWPDSYEVLLSTRDNTERSFTVTLQAMATAPTNNQWNEVVIDLSAYKGQIGYIAIHHVSYDCNYLLIDDFKISNSGEWTEVDNVTSPYTIEGLTPETTYEVQVQGENANYGTSAWTPSTLFTTLNGMGVPTIVSVDPTATTADVAWTAGENNAGWNLRWRPYVEPTMETITWDFPVVNGTSVDTGGWSHIDNDEDGYDWGLMATDGDDNTDPTDACWYSQSYINNVGAVTPDNWLVSPEVQLGGSIKFKAWRSEYPGEVLGVYVYQEGSEYLTHVGQDIQPTESEVEYEFNLSDFTGTGRIVICHYNCTDGFYVFVDDITVTYPTTAAGEWNYVYNLEDTEHQITGLTPETTYEVQVQGVNGEYTSDWTASTLFTTLAESVTLAELVADGVQGESYNIENGNIIAVKLGKDGKTLYCKDDGKFASPFGPAEGQTDYVVSCGLMEEYDQSNWVALTITEGEFPASILGHTLSGVKGVYSDAVNPTLSLSALPNYTLQQIATQYAYNIYVPANFMYTTQTTEHGKEFFFMTPKPMEVLTVYWAMWDGENNYFVMPTKSSSSEVTWNEAGLMGVFTPNFDLYEGDVPNLEANVVYTFSGVVKKVVKNNSPVRALDGETTADEYEVYPLSGIEEQGRLNGDIPTSVNDLVVGRSVKSVTYYNVHGQASMTPFSGLNMVEVRYTDGTRRVVKIMK